MPKLTATARYRHLLIALLVLTAACDRRAAAPQPGGTGTPCTSRTDCPRGQACVDSLCVADNAPGMESAGPGKYREPRWIALEGGTFEMGCSPGDSSCRDDELPRHTVTVAPFDMLETEVTEYQYESLMGDNPSCHLGRAAGPDMPVECVSWDRAMQLCATLGGRLPTEAEWELAARAGTTTRYYCGDDEACLDAIAWYGANSAKTKHDVAGKVPNAFGLYDMIGNVYEWTLDFHSEKYPSEPNQKDPLGPPEGLYRTRRGGDFYSFDARDLRVSSRTYRGPWDGPGNLGFRCVRPSAASGRGAPESF